MSEPEWSERDLLFATTLLLRNLAAWMVVSKAMTPEKLEGIIKITTVQLAKEGDTGPAQKALNAVFGEHLTNQLKNLTTLLEADASGTGTA